MFGYAGLLAHQGGWDELLLVAAPIAIFVLLLKVANARAGHLGAAAAPEQAEPAPPRPADRGADPSNPPREP